MRTLTLYLNLLFIGLATSYISVAYAIDSIIVCPILSSGDVCIFDIEATADGTLQIDTQSSLEGELWRVIAVEMNQPPAISDIGSGSTMDFSGTVQQLVGNGRQYQAFVTYEGPLPGMFPTHVMVRFDGPVTVSGPRPQGNPALSGRYTGRHSGGGFSFGIEVSDDGTRVVRLIANLVSCATGGGGFDIDLSPGIPIMGQRFRAEGIAFTDTGPFEIEGLFDIDGIFFDADAFGGTLEQALGGFSMFRSATRCNLEWAAAAVATDRDEDGWSNTAELRLGAAPTLSTSTPEHIEVPTTTLRGPDTCQDFIDNDRDGFIDGDDPGCM